MPGSQVSVYDHAHDDRACHFTNPRARYHQIRAYEDTFIPTTEHEIDQLLFSNRPKKMVSTKVRPTLFLDNTFRDDAALNHGHRISLTTTHAQSEPRFPTDIAECDPLTIIKKSQQKLCLVNRCMDEIIQDLEPISQKLASAKQTRYKTVTSSVTSAKESVMEIVRLNNTERQRFSNSSQTNAKSANTRDPKTLKEAETIRVTSDATAELTRRNYVQIEKITDPVDTVKAGNETRVPFPDCDSRNYISRSFRQDSEKADSRLADEHIYESIVNDFDEVIFSDIQKVPPALPPRPVAFCEKTGKASIAKLATRSPRMGIKMLHRDKQQQTIKVSEEASRKVTRRCDELAPKRHLSVEGNRRVECGGSSRVCRKESEYAVVTDYKQYTVDDVIESIRRVEGT